MFGTLTDDRRNDLAQEILNRELFGNPNLAFIFPQRYLKLADEIVKLFPNSETTVTYYVPHIRKTPFSRSVPARGKLFFGFHNRKKADK